MNSDKEIRPRLDLASWRFKPSRFGCLGPDAGEIEFKPLTLVCGPNNTGKTWVLYALYGFLSYSGPLKLPTLDELAAKLTRDGEVTWDFGQWAHEHAKKLLTGINQGIKLRLPSIFNADPEVFKDSRFDWIVDSRLLVERAVARGLDFRLMIGRNKNEVLRILKPAGTDEMSLTLLSGAFPDTEVILSEAIAFHMVGIPQRRNAFLMPAERSGLHLFYRELSNRRAALLHHAAKKDKDIDISQLIHDVVRSRYAQPIADYIDWLNDLPDIRKKRSGPFHALAEEVKQLIGGRYEIAAEGDISFTPYKLKRGDKEVPPRMDLHLTSSTVKSLFGLWAYLQFDAEPGDVVMIDEPELNLHPANQRKLARLVARLINSDLRVVLSTHSDYRLSI